MLLLLSNDGGNPSVYHSAMGPMPPEGEKTRGEKILRTLKAVVLLSVLLSGIPVGVV